MSGDKLTLIRNLHDVLIDAEKYDRGWNLIDKYTKPLLGNKITSKNK